MEFRLERKLPTPEEYNLLRASAGWTTFDTGVARTYLPNSLFAVCVYDGDRIIGMGRVIGDGGLYFYVQDIVVLPEYQGKGIGSRIMTEVMAYLRERANDATGLGLMAAAGKEGFYERYGFERRPNQRHGSGMTQFVRKR